MKKLIYIPFVIMFSVVYCLGNTFASNNVISLSLVANAGSDVSMLPNSFKTLSASLSTSSKGIMTYHWALSEIVSGDISAEVNIENADQENVNVLIGSVTATTVFKIALTLTDASGATSIDFVNITILYEEIIDGTISAGANINASSSDIVSLLGTVVDSNVEIAKIRWLQISGEILVTLINSDTLSPTFIAPWVTPENNQLIFRLIVTDINGNSFYDEVSVTLTNTTPLADPGVSRVVLSGTQVSLDGSESKGINGGSPSAYHWQSIGLNTVALTSANTATASFTAPVVTQATPYEFNLTVTDNGQTDTQTVIISVVNELTYNDFGGRYYGVELDTVNKIAYMAKGEGGLGIYDISMPSNIEPLAIFNTQGNAQDVLVSNGYAYIADQFNDLVVVNISNPATPSLVTNLTIDAFGNRATALAKHGDYLYMSGYYAGLITIDIQNPETPTVVSSVDTVGKAVGLKVSADGQVAYVADSSNGFVVFDLSNPSNPVPIFTVSTSTDAYDLAVDGNYLYVADGVNGLSVYDVSNQSIAPVFVNTINTNGVARKVTVNDSVLCLADGNQGVKLFDISNPTTPTLLASYNTSGETEDVAVLGNHVVVADSYAGMAIIDFSDINLPSVTSTYTTIGTGKGISIKDNYAYVVDFYNGLVILDVSNPFSPKLASHLSYDKESRGITVAGDYAFIANGNNGLKIIDISDPLNPQSVATASLSLNVAQSVSLSDDGTLAYVAGFYGGLYVVDITDKTHPQGLAFNNFGGSQSKFVTQLNDTVYVANGDHSFAIANIVNPNVVPNTAVLLPESFSAAKKGDGHMVVVKGDYAYLAHNAAGLAVIDVSNVAVPSIIGEYTGGLKSINSVFIHGTTLYATNSNVDSQRKGTDDFLIAWDISTQGTLPNTPSASLNIGGQYPAIDSVGNYLIMVGEGVKAVDITNPLNPHR